MAQTERSTDIAKPPEEVFPYLFEPDLVPQWTTGLNGYERLDDGPLRTGSRFREQLEVSGQQIDTELEITAYDPPRRRRVAHGDPRHRRHQHLHARARRRRHPPHADDRGDRRRAEGPGPDPGHPAPPREEARRRSRGAQGPPGLVHRNAEAAYPFPEQCAPPSSPPSRLRPPGRRVAAADPPWSAPRDAQLDREVHQRPCRSRSRRAGSASSPGAPASRRSVSLATRPVAARPRRSSSTRGSAARSSPAR